MNVIQGSVYTIGQIVFTVLKIDVFSQSADVRHMNQKRETLTFQEIRNLIISHSKTL